MANGSIFLSLYLENQWNSIETNSLNWIQKLNFDQSYQNHCNLPNQTIKNTFSGNYKAQPENPDSFVWCLSLIWYIIYCIWVYVCVSECVDVFIWKKKYHPKTLMVWLFAWKKFNRIYVCFVINYKLPS